MRLARVCTQSIKTGVVMEGIQNKVVIITGASSGIGEKTARKLSAEGAITVLVARRKERIDALTQEINSSGGSAMAIVADITDNEVCKSVINQVKDRYGKIDVLVNNAGVMLIGQWNEASVEEWESMVKVNLLGLMYMTHAALPEMNKNGTGHIVNVSSVSGRTTKPGSSAYNSTKWGVNAFTDAIRQELSQSKSGIRTTLIEPGAVETELINHNRPEIRERLSKNYVNMVRLQPEDIADAIAYAISRPARVSINEMLIRPTEQVG